MGQEFLKQRNEKRDFIDVKLIEFLKKCVKCDIYLMHNFFYKNKQNQIKKEFISFLDRHKIDTIILSGGQSYGENKLRDQTEINLIQYVLRKNIKLIGICRGMQVINLFFNGNLKKIKKHIRTKNTIISSKGKTIRKIKCFHGNGIKKIGLGLEETFKSTDNEIEAFKHIEKKILGIMWHPERNKTFEKNDLNLFKKFLNR